MQRNDTDNETNLKMCACDGELTARQDLNLVPQEYIQVCNGPTV
jgi:hypothetical protein